MATNRIKIENRFPAAREAAWAATRAAVQHALIEGENEAKNKLARGESQRGYALNTLYDSIHKEGIGPQSGRVVAEPFYARFFEFGTVSIRPLPFMRPASSRMRKVFKEDMGLNFERFLRRRAGVR